MLSVELKVGFGGVFLSLGYRLWVMGYGLGVTDFVLWIGY